MKRFIFALIPVLTLACITLASCSDDDDKPVGPTNEEITLTPSKTTLDADGKDAVTFTVTLGNTDITKDAVIFNNTTNLEVKDPTFSTEVSGTFEFQASYNGKLSNKVNVEAKLLADNANKIAMIHLATATWCPPCYVAKTPINNILKQYDGKVLLAAHHNSDEYNTEENHPALYAFSQELDISGIPTMYVDLNSDYKVSVNNTQYLLDRYVTQALETPATTRVKIDSELSGDKLTVKVGINALKEGKYSLCVTVVEDGIEGRQISGQTYIPYTHNNVVRVMGTTFSGDTLGTLSAGDVKEKEVVINWDSEWKQENCRIYAYVRNAAGFADNANVCAVGGSVGY